jgi:hypothetical protein
MPVKMVKCAFYTDIKKKVISEAIYSPTYLTQSSGTHNKATMKNIQLYILKRSERLSYKMDILHKQKMT